MDTERQDLQKLFRFDLWCTRKLADWLKRQPSFKEKTACKAFLSHIINTQEIWFERIIPVDFDDYTDIWDEYPIAEIKSRANEANQKWIDLIGDYDMDLDELILYQNEFGVEYRQPFRQICEHLIKHGQHHRAQISMFAAKCDVVAPTVDFHVFEKHVNREGYAGFQ